MALAIETFSNERGGSSFFKAIGHPLAVPKAHALLDRLADAGPVAIYDPLGHAKTFAALYDLDGLEIAGTYVQALEEIGSPLLGQPAQPVTDLPDSPAASILITAFDADRLRLHVEHLIPGTAEVYTLDELRLDPEMQTDRRTYLAPVNFATNFVFFRDQPDRHIRVVTANYWAGYGANEVRLWMCLFDGDGSVLAQWTEDQSDVVAGIVIDSREVRERFRLDDFCGQLYLHVLGAAGHDVVKYALDTYGDVETTLSCTHDANAWPSELYAGLPAPQDGETVTLWIQNSHPCAIPTGTVGLNRMGHNATAYLQREVPAFGSYPLDVAELLPDLKWPEQIEIRAGKHFVRPRYEVQASDGRQRIAHPNVQRTDLKPDPRLPELSNLMGKGYVLPAPILPTDRYQSEALPTPMSTAQDTLSLALIANDASGQEVARRRLGCLARDHATAVDLDELLREAGAELAGGYGHMELVYDFANGGSADGWLHGLFRYRDRSNGHVAETSFGAHVFNTVLTYKNEPQSYAGRAPGLSTRLFLRLGAPPHDTICHLIYPASTPWHATSDTALILHSGDGSEIGSRRLEIACGGSRFFRASELFGHEALANAGRGRYVLIRDTTCRLFGYHGLVNGEASFSLDHMFGF